jgi:hypothetical protein
VELAFFTESRRRSLNRNVPLTAVVIPTCGYVLPSSVCHTVVMLKLRSAEYDAVYVGGQALTVQCLHLVDRTVG